MKRFWDMATADAGAILLDGKPVRLPGGAPLRVAPETLAHAVAAEWNAAGGAKGGAFTAEDTPLTRLAGTAQERIAAARAETEAALAAYAESDLLCYRAETPPALAARQDAAWQPWLGWAAERYGARLLVTRGLTHVVQPAAAVAALRGAVAACSVEALAGLGLAVPALGSLVLGLALAEGAIDAADAHRAAALDDLFQTERWGADAEADARRAAVAADIALAARFMTLART